MISHCNAIGKDEMFVRMKQVGDEQEEKGNFMEEWEWNIWVSISIDNEIPGQYITNWYSGPDGLRPGVGTNFDNVPLCSVNITAINYDFFMCLASHSNKYTRNYMAARNTSLYLCCPWKEVQQVKWYASLV
eukprot:4799675-Ditylum_brightwellii.AAC.1